MAVTTHWYTTAFKDLIVNAPANSLWDWDTDTIKVSLHTVTYAVAQNTDTFWSSATNEVTSTNYTTGGATLAGCAASVASNVAQFTATSPTTWTTVTFTARYAVIYKSTGTASTSPLIAYVDFGADQTVSGGNFSITWDATGVIKATAS